MSLRALVAVMVTTTMMVLPRAWADTAWESYKSRFMMADGRIVDTGNGSVSHTEGQGVRHASGGRQKRSPCL
ncbi:Endoglucanase precursor [Raoultella terrigena]|uniref:cellulase n=1 Tax=Raoultella terrigena TaxID=577 RepID=A0A485CRV3_RAOTE|nr:Endoglucanase precursor [Raoultella terrigena]